jgi:hypothetical protein
MRKGRAMDRAARWGSYCAPASKAGENFGGLFGRLRDQASGFERAADARHLVGQEELDKLLEARDDADVLALDVEEQRTARPDTRRQRRFRADGTTPLTVATLRVSAFWS